jgi:hypothetical protein
MEDIVLNPGYTLLNNFKLHKEVLKDLRGDI